MKKFIATLVVLNIGTLVWFGLLWKTWKYTNIFSDMLIAASIVSVLGLVLAGFKKIKWLSIILLILPLLFVIAIEVYIKILHGGY
jgi:hypothetical protein